MPAHGELTAIPSVITSAGVFVCLEWALQRGAPGVVGVCGRAVFRVWAGRMSYPPHGGVAGWPGGCVGVGPRGSGVVCCWLDCGPPALVPESAVRGVGPYREASVPRAVVGLPSRRKLKLNLSAQGRSPPVDVSPPPSSVPDCGPTVARGARGSCGPVHLRWASIATCFYNGPGADPPHCPTPRGVSSRRTQRPGRVPPDGVRKNGNALEYHVP